MWIFCLAMHESCKNNEYELNNNSKQDKNSFVTILSSKFLRNLLQFTELSRRKTQRYSKLLFSISKDFNYRLRASFHSRAAPQTQNYVDLRFDRGAFAFNSFPPLRISAEASILMKSRKTFQEISHKFIIAIV